MQLPIVLDGSTTTQTVLDLPEVSEAFTLPIPSNTSFSPHRGSVPGRLHHEIGEEID